MVMQKFNNLIERLKNKVRMSATPVQGFILGMSGTDSIVTYILLNEVAKTEKFTVSGIHYERPFTDNSLFSRLTLPWLKSLRHTRGYEYGDVDIPFYCHDNDYHIWADLHSEAAITRNWVVSTVNATEKALGTFSIMANSASIAPITSLYKSEILQICKEYNVPEDIIKRSRIPDCICGRDEFAAENIELIDSLLSNKYNGGASDDSLIKAYEYIRETKRQNDFKNRTPYLV